MSELKEQIEDLKWKKFNIFVLKHQLDQTKNVRVIEIGYADLLESLLFAAAEHLDIRKCDEVQNYEGSGMFNKHDPECRKCKTLALIAAKVKEAAL